MLSALQVQFERQRQEAVQNLDPSRISKSYTRKDWLNDLVNWAAASESMSKALEPIVYTALIESGREALLEVGRQPSTYDPFTPAIRDYYVNRSRKIAADVNDETEKQLRAALSKGAQAGETTVQLRARIEAVMGSASTMRADRIARTEVSRAQGFADVEAWQQSGVVQGKEWFTAEDERVCNWCGPLDGRVVSLTDNFFSKGDTYNSNGKPLKLDYDDIPSSPLHVNCRCVLLPVRK